MMEKPIAKAFLFSVGTTLALGGFLLLMGLPLHRLVPYVEPPDLNERILDVIESYPSDGSYQVMPKEMWNTHYGTTQDLYYQGKRIAKGDPQNRSYCTGIVFEAYWRALSSGLGNHLYDLDGVSVDEMRELRRDFYGVNGDRRTLLNALASRGLGREITDLREAKPGDVVQFWRHSGSGHSAVLLSVNFDESGEIPQSLTFWSAHSGKGLSEKTEIIGRAGPVINVEEIYLVRPYRL